MGEKIQERPTRDSMTLMLARGECVEGSESAIRELEREVWRVRGFNDPIGEEIVSWRDYAEMLQEQMQAARWAVRELPGKAAVAALKSVCRKRPQAAWLLEERKK